MSTQKVNIQHKRFFSDEFKKARVKEYESGKFTVRELGRLFGIQTKVIYRWIYKYSTYNKESVKIVEMKDSGTKKLKDMELRINEMEQIIGRKQLQIDYLEKLIELANEKFDTDIKKNSDTPQSNGFRTTNTK